MRITPGTPGTYMLVRDGTLYAATTAGGMGVHVVDLSSLGEMAGSMGADSGGADGQTGPQITIETAEEVTGLEATGRQEVVAGIEGELYEIGWIDSGGEHHTDQMVLTDNPLAVEMGQAFAAMAAATNGEVEPRQAAIVERGLGILRYGQAFVVESLTDESRPASEFELPAEPTNIGDMMGAFGSAP
ncbi:hypothetical protein [Fodinicurvata sp. EGI_FJ10296]|uniref:hypothetical protein n=1 Tax=Fodinicurvata sp. EGI_FJ10296 TaxID=3231908 RepID=UPI003455C5A5